MKDKELYESLAFFLAAYRYREKDCRYREAKQLKCRRSKKYIGCSNCEQYKNCDLLAMWRIAQDDLRDSADFLARFVSKNYKDLFSKDFADDYKVISKKICKIINELEGSDKE